MLWVAQGLTLIAVFYLCCAWADHNKVCKYLDTFDKAFIVLADNVGSKQFQDIRRVGDEGANA